ncbi:unnamed protein product [Polarella glacialis]|uniref:Uncharacterized protein n=1 Tax=Polarella glacialis TaxID=89957 RepID=A0A813EYG9_POLGL|nr:unnamed protein product [Polarella glacialis]CAE8618838.1 unnamed protein product [Polarella glacialis]CAE8710585.1 unnamed protein product [Polarella glacialis]|eukprot:CAMPEP_0115100112 /NCGR_PEP_ID=MMETSP0227-20121206/32322_1 /TAXON_ID=89957 /ORGANISM="Polarella glacialis, Strain CCMP 1383" /LENGTH=245 /DNA_ID=CAMNT_0002495369 /DNA_START=79 /DNA_END=816 /DNA_ORIENTATION=-
MSDGYRNRTNNAVLMKDDVGKAKPTVYSLPHEGHAYGRSEPADVEGAREVTMHWAAHVPRPKMGPETQDFRKLNRAAAKSGVRHAKDLAEFRKGVDIKLIPSGPSGCLPKVIPSDVIPSFAYGQKSRPSTPIAHVVGNTYAMEYEEVMEKGYRALEQDKLVYSKTKIKLTKAAKDRIVAARSRNMMEMLNEAPKEPFKLSKFKKVTARIVLPGLSKASSMPNIRAYAQPEAMSAAEMDTADYDDY